MSPKLAVNLTKKLLKVYHEMCHTQFKKQNIVWTLSLQLISVKTHQMKNIQTHHYSLKYKKLNMQFCQLWPVVIFYAKINRLFLMRDAKLKNYDEKKNQSNPRFSASFFSGATANKIYFDIKTEKQ
jgi:hypothetical protein